MRWGRLTPPGEPADDDSRVNELRVVASNESDERVLAAMVRFLRTGDRGELAVAGEIYKVA